MRKRIITPTAETIRSREEGWLEVERAAIVEITSEDKDSLLSSIFFSGPGTQTSNQGFINCRYVGGIALTTPESLGHLASRRLFGNFDLVN